MNQRIDWTKVTLLLLILGGGAYMAKDISLPNLTPPRIIPPPDEARQQTVQPVRMAATQNPQAAKVLGSFFADFAWLILHGEKENYTTGELELQLNEGGRRLLAMKSEVGASNLSPSVNAALDSLWGSTSKKISKEEAAQAIYALAWALN